MGLRPVLRLGSHHLAQLSATCTVYRSYVWQHVMPSPERNQVVRHVQALQGRLKKALTQEPAETALSLTEEEVCTLKHLFFGVTQYYAATPASERRIQQLAEVTALRVLVERMLH